VVVFPFAPPALVSQSIDRSARFFRLAIIKRHAMAGHYGERVKKRRILRFPVLKEFAKEKERDLN
jgi:hypothetical protein